MKTRYHNFVVYICAVASVILIGCAALQPGADPVIVRAQQVEESGKATFDFVLRLDSADRGFWRTNAPAFHNFCEWLREPQGVLDTTNIILLPRCSAMILSLDNLRRDYKASKVSSNILLQSIAVLESVTVQADAWTKIVTNKPAQ